jgi:asparagine synthase (glutamine-hydrolysing)
MCGICGISGERPVHAERLRAMTAAMRHRGPDADGYFLEAAAGLGLGHRRLKVIDLEGGVQPMADESGRSVIIFNGEIYNFRELRSALEAKGRRFRTRSDTEVILQQYLEDGPDCVKRFNGMFAFAIWDRSLRRLMLARDRLGVKPLYYVEDGSRLLFASELRPLLIGLGRTPPLDPESLFAYLALQYVPAPKTIFQGIMKLPPATVMLVDENGPRLSTYWALPEVEPDLSGAAAAGAIRELLEDSVRLRLISDVPLGAFLSGGIDSSLVVALMRKHKAAGLKTFSVDFAGGPGAAQFNETSWSELASASFGTEHYPLTVTARDLIAALPEVVSRLDDPVADPAAVPTFLVSRLAREQVTVALTGEGADELFGGYLRYALGGLARFYHPIPRMLRRLLLELPARGLPHARRIRKALAALGQDSPARRHLAWVGVFSEEMLQRLLGGAAGRERVEGSFARWFQGQTQVYSLEKTLRADLATWLPDDLLVKVDRMSMASGLEARTPYLDYRLVELAFRIPDREKVRGLTGKLILKRAAQGLVPEAIIRRKKAGFTLPLNAWFRGELKELMLSRLEPERLRASGTISPEPVQTLIAEHLSGRENHGQELWSLLIFELWRDTMEAKC